MLPFIYPAGLVTLRHLCPADLPAFAAYRADPAVCRYQGFAPYTGAEAAAFLAGQVQAPVPPAPGQWAQLAIARTADGLLLGDCALHLLADAPDTAEIGITLAATQQGRGHARAALRGLLGYCFADLKLRRVLALTDVRNVPCIGLLEAVGMRREGHFLANGFYKGEWCDEYRYALLAREWAA